MRGPMPTRRGRPGRSRPSRRPGVRAVSGGCAPGPPVPASPPCGGGGPGCGGLGPPAALVRASGGRLAYRRGVPARPGGAASPPGAAAAASAGPVPGGPGSPGPRSPGRLVVAAGLRPPGPPCEGAARPASARPPRPVRPAPGPPGRPLSGRPPPAWAAAWAPSPGRWCGGRQRPPWSVSAPGVVGVGAGPAWVLLRPWWALLPCCVAAGGCQSIGDPVKGKTSGRRGTGRP